jgi:hypothetical protein
VGTGLVFEGVSEGRPVNCGLLPYGFVEVYVKGAQELWDVVDWQGGPIKVKEEVRYLPILLMLQHAISELLVPITPFLPVILPLVVALTYACTYLRKKRRPCPSLLRIETLMTSPKPKVERAEEVKIEEAKKLVEGGWKPYRLPNKNLIVFKKGSQSRSIGLKYDEALYRELRELYDKLHGRR